MDRAVAKRPEATGSRPASGGLPGQRSAIRQGALGRPFVVLALVQAGALVLYVAMRESLSLAEIFAGCLAMAYPPVALAGLRAGIPRKWVATAASSAAALAATALCLPTGGLRSPCLVLFATIPSGSVSYGGSRSAARMLAITTAMLLAIAALDLSGHLPASAITAREWPKIALLMTLYSLIIVGLTAVGAETSRMRVKQTLGRALVQAEEASRVKSQFLAMMSHELRTPMTGVLGMLDLLRGSALSKEQAGFVDTLRSSADALLVVLNDVLDLSKIEAGHLRLEAVPFHPAGIAREVAALFAPAAARSGVAIEAHVDVSVPPRLAGDPTRVRQVLANLVGNAVKFTAAGRIDIVMGYEPPRVGEDPRGRLVVEVHDSGIGISPEAITRLFEPFRQADEATSRRFGGTGLGLAICKRLCEAMGGSIEVESKLGEGSVFRCRFALREDAGEASRFGMEASADGLASVEARSTEEVTGPAIPHRALRILLAEDNPVNQMVIRKTLERRGHQVTLAANGALAVEAVKKGSFDLVLMDMQMPVMDGAEATRAIRRLDGAASTLPIYALSADVITERQQAYLGAGLDGFLRKPIDWASVEKVLSRVAPADRPNPSPGAIAPSAAAKVS